MLRVQHIFYTNSFNFLVTWGLSVTIFHSTCIFCVYGMALYWPTLQFYLCMYVLFVSVCNAPWRVLLQQYCCEDYFSSSSMVSRTFSVLCVYSKFRHHPHPLGYVCAKFGFFCNLHCWASPWRIIAYSITQSITQLIWCPGNRSLCCRIINNKSLNENRWMGHELVTPNQHQTGVSHQDTIINLPNVHWPVA